VSKLTPRVPAPVWLRGGTCPEVSDSIHDVILAECPSPMLHVFLDETNNNNFETAMEFCQKGHQSGKHADHNGVSPVYVARSANSTISLWFCDGNPHD